VIYSMGKTGTTSLTEAIEAATGRPTLKVHSLNKVRLDFEIQRALAADPRAHARFQWRSDVLRRYIVSSRRRQWELVSVVRDPIARAVSAYFFGLRTDRKTAAVRSPADVANDARAVEALIRRITLDRDWFVEELQQLTGFDIYSARFPIEQGYQIVEHGRFRILLLRTEDLPATAPTAAAEFLGVSGPLELPRSNAGAGADHAYESFIDSHRFPNDLVDAVYATPMMRHFYDAGQLDRFRARWAP